MPRPGRPGRSRSSTSSSKVQVPRRFASSMTANPAGAIRPAAVRRSTRSLFERAHVPRGRRGENHCKVRSGVKLDHLRVDPAEAERLLDGRGVVDDRRVRSAAIHDHPGPRCARVVRRQPGAPLGTGQRMHDGPSVRCEVIGHVAVQGTILIQTRPRRNSTSRRRPARPERARRAHAFVCHARRAGPSRRFSTTSRKIADQSIDSSPMNSLRGLIQGRTETRRAPPNTSRHARSTRRSGRSRSRPWPDPPWPAPEGRSRRGWSRPCSPGNRAARAE